MGINMNETEKQNYIRLQTMKLQKLSNIISAVNESMYNVSTNIRSVSDYNDFENYSNIYLFQMIDEYKELLIDFGELK